MNNKNQGASWFVLTKQARKNRAAAISSALGESYLTTTTERPGRRLPRLPPPLPLPGVGAARPPARRHKQGERGWLVPPLRMHICGRDTIIIIIHTTATGYTITPFFFSAPFYDCFVSQNDNANYKMHQQGGTQKLKDKKKEADTT